MPLPPLPRRDVLIASGLLLTGCSSAARTLRAATSTGPTSAGSGLAGPGQGSASPAATAAAAGVDRPDVAHGPRVGHTVALTFHGAGDAATTRSVLAALAAAQARVTVFAVGSWLAAQPELARAVLDGGHELGNHTYHHLPMRRLSAAQARQEVAGAAAELMRLIGNHGAWFRPSGTQTSTPLIRSAARASGYPVCVSYDVDSLDWTDPGPTAVTRVVLQQTRPGSIVSMHLGHAGTAIALPRILAGLAQRGLSLATVTELVR